MLVKSADRLARSTVDLLSIVERIKGKGAAVRFVDTPSLDTDSAHGSFMLTIFGAVAEFERATIRECQAEGIAAAKAKGRYRCELKLTAAQIIEARVRIASGASKAAAARELGVSRQTLYTALAGDGVYGTQEAA